MFPTAPPAPPADNLCDVCQKPMLGNPGLPDEKVCLNPACVHLMKQKKTLPPILFENIFRIQSQQIRDMNQRAAADEERRKSIDLSIRKDDQELVNQLKNELPDQDAQSSRLISIASANSTLVPLPKKRKEAFENYLKETLATAFSGKTINSKDYAKNRSKLTINNKQNQKVADLENFTGKICSQCRGGCCIAGGNEAFLEVPALRQQINRHPDLTEESALALYLNRLPEKHVEGSCVFHAANGCNLPTDLRSDVCNAYLCNPLTEHREASVEANTVLPALVVSRNYRHYHRYDEEANHEVVSVSVTNADKQRLIDVKNIN